MNANKNIWGVCITSYQNGDNLYFTKSGSLSHMVNRTIRGTRGWATRCAKTIRECAPGYYARPFAIHIGGAK